MKSKVTALATASLLASTGLLGASAPAARATGDLIPLPPRAGAVTPTWRHGGGPQRSAAGRGDLQAAGTATDGTVTLVDSTETDTDETFTITQGSATIGVFPGYGAGDISEPQLLPAGTYTVTDTAGVAGTFSVVAGGDVEEVLYPIEGGNVFRAYTDDVSEADQSSILSFRNTTATPVEVYIDDRLVASVPASGQDDLAVPATGGTFAVVPSGSGTPSAGNTVASGSLAATPDTYSSLYLATDGTDVSLVEVDLTHGYQFTAGDGGVFTYGGDVFDGSLGGLTLDRPIVGGAEAQDGSGYYLVAADGGVFAFGGAPFLGSLGGTPLASPIVGMATVIGPGGGDGYYLVAADGGVFAFGDAAFYGSWGGTALASPVVGIAADPLDGDYVLAQADGGVTVFEPGLPNGGNLAPFQVASHLDAPIVGIASTPDGDGDWLVASDGGVFSVGDAPYVGSTGGLALNQPVVAISPSADGLGYALIARDGGVFDYGDSLFYGSTGAIALDQPVVGAIDGAAGE